MGEPKPETSLLIPLPDLCPVRKEGSENEGDIRAFPSLTSLRPRTASSPSPACVTEGRKSSSTVKTGVGSPSIGHGSEETCSNDLAPKLVSTTSHTEANSTEKAEVAVREEHEEDTKEDDLVSSQSQRQSPSPSPSFATPSKLPLSDKLPLTSALKKSTSPPESAKKGKGGNYRTRRRIRGIWGDDNDSPFSGLHDETLLLIMKYLSMKDLCISSMVCQRWKHVSLHQDSWKRIDATEFVKSAYDHYARGDASETSPVRSGAPKYTSLALADRMEKNSPLVLEIRSIDYRLSADNFLSSLPSLQELTLTSFDELTDTHIHVLLVSSSYKNAQAKAKRSCILKKLALEECPRLTNASIQSIGKFCPELEELSVKGSPKITDLSPLNELWHTIKKPLRLAPSASARPSPATPLSAMAMLFSGPPPPAPAPAPAPLPPRPSTPTTSLQSLFAPPGQSPPRAASVISVLPRTLSRGSSTIEPGKLTRINVSHTGVSPKSLLTAWETLPPGRGVRLEHLEMEGTGESWNDALLTSLAETLDLPKLHSLNIGCSPAFASRVTDKGLRSLLTGKDSLCSLTRLNLSGHASLTGTCLSEIITAASLEELVLDRCTGLSTKSSDPAKDFASCDALAKAILKCTTRTINNHSNRDSAKEVGRGLRRLSLSRCFSNQSKLHRNSSLQMHEETLGRFLLEAIGPPKPKKKKKQASSTSSSSCNTTTTAIATLHELDLTDCWFVTSADIASLEKRCPGLDRFRLKGTRAEVGEAKAAAS